MTKEYISLLIKREKKEVLGKYYANLWLLTIVLIATFLSISFSNASLSYLQVKMDDPFTNWVDVPNNFENSKRLESFKSQLEENDSLYDRFLYNNVQTDKFNLLNLFDKHRKERRIFSCRFFGNMNSDLIKAILDEKNVVGNAAIPYENIPKKETYGAIITLDVLKKQGYSEDSIPAYIYVSMANTGADTLGVELADGKYAAMPIPVLAVVNRLPSDIDIITSKYFYDAAYTDHTFCFLDKSENQKKSYIETLFYFVPEGGEEIFKSFVANIEYAGESGEVYAVLDDSFIKKSLSGWKNGNIYQVNFGPQEKLPIDASNNINRIILNEFKDIERLYNYMPATEESNSGSYISINFTSLDSIRSFEQYAKQEFEILLDMAQVESKENFNAVSIMANILSFAMIVFSMVCIIMFIVNMLQSYFQKVKRNLGTFKAFGICSIELTNIYVVILLGIVCVAIIFALSVTWLIQFTLPLIGVMKDGEFNYLDLWSIKTLVSIIIVIVATFVTVRIVMGKLLKQTPGDLIYDR